LLTLGLASLSSSCRTHSTDSADPAAADPGQMAALASGWRSSAPSRQHMVAVLAPPTMQLAGL
jgi:hypothetical protein